MITHYSDNFCMGGANCYKILKCFYCCLLLRSSFLFRFTIYATPSLAYLALLRLLSLKGKKGLEIIRQHKWRILNASKSKREEFETTPSK